MSGSLLIRKLSWRLRSLHNKYYLYCALTFVLTIFVTVVFLGFPQDEYSSSIPSAHFDYLRKKVERSLNITIVVVVEEHTDLSEYSTALNTVECYAARHAYPLLVVRDSEYSSKCTQKDMMFRRHCVVAEILSTTDWVLFIDADMAVVNPERLIEEFADDNYDITFYDRFFNWEVAAGSYLVKNTQWARTFLYKFADYEQQVPDSFAGTDNGALHAFLAEILYPDLRDEIQVCIRIWQQSDGYRTLFLYEACLRAVIGLRGQLQHVRILKKGRGWVRDIWLTDSRWSDDDFMLHALQDKKMGELPSSIVDRIRLIGADRFTWYNPLTKRHNIRDCKDQDYQWPYQEKLRVSKMDIDRKLNEIARDVEKQRWTAMKDVAAYI